ncbi:MAG: ASCH domain-containing protein [Phycisphaeraceae bacterium]|nr:MAG: ASCH domain-containing protein [Phycisphaeraceae bacterium]
MRFHIAVVHRRYLELILSGVKTAEARLGKTRREPYASLREGEPVFFKQAGGPIRARAVASRVHRFELTDSGDLDRVRRRFERRLGGPSPYWAERAEARFATIIELDRVEPIDAAPAWYRPTNTRSAWRVFENGAGSPR